MRYPKIFLRILIQIFYSTSSYSSSYIRLNFFQYEDEISKWNHFFFIITSCKFIKNKRKIILVKNEVLSSWSIKILVTYYSDTVQIIYLGKSKITISIGHEVLSITYHTIVSQTIWRELQSRSPLVIWCTWLSARLCHYSDNDRCGGSGRWNCSVTMRRGTSSPRGQAASSYLVQGGSRRTDIQVNFILAFFIPIFISHSYSIARAKMKKIAKTGVPFKQFRGILISILHVVLFFDLKIKN